MVVPVRSAKGLAVNTGLSLQHLSMDANRVAGVPNPAGGVIFVYDIASGLSAAFPAPPGNPFYFTPMIYGNTIVLGASPALAAPSTIFYCKLPQAPPPVMCPPGGPGSWAPIPGTAGVEPSFPQFAGFFGGPVFNRDVIAWPEVLGLDYFQFTTDIVTFIPLPAQSYGVSTNGAIIAFVSGGTLQYVDITSCIGPCAPAVVNTFLPAANGPTAVSQDIIAFDEPGAPSLVRYYNVLTGVASLGGAGPIGTISATDSSGVWGDRIAFWVSETDLGFDCGGAAGIQAGEFCVRYWNIRNPVALLAPPAAPSMGTTHAVAIYDRFIAYVAANGALEYINVPMQGDVNYDGQVNILDIAAAAFCFGQVIKNTVPPC